MKPPVIAIIPARGGSKGLPGKNIALLNNKPLIRHTIDCALESTLFDAILVTTDCDNIANVAHQAGEKVTIIKRPQALATDKALTFDAANHAIKKFYNIKPIHADLTIMLLQPTSPLRTHKHIAEAFEKFNEDTVNSVISVVEEEHSAFKNFIIKDDASITPLFTIEHLSMPRQNLPKIVRQNGAIYIIKYKHFLQNKSFYAEPSWGYMMDNHASIDIDTLKDLETAEKILTNV